MRYGRTGPGLSSFSREHACRGSPLRRGVGVLSGLGTRDVLHCPAYTYALQRAIPSARARFTSPSLHRKPVRYRNLDRLPISCALRLRLRPRLTLTRLSLARKPWSSGVRVSHPHSRYLCLHLLFRLVQHASRRTFAHGGMLPYRYLYPTASAACFMPVYYPRPAARLVSCYALFK